jgi:aconitate hydratase
VVAYALAGTVDFDLATDVIGKSKDGKDVFLKDLWPTNAEIQEVMARCVTKEQFKTRYAAVFEGPKEWQEIPATKEAIYGWPASSTYIQEPPYFMNMPKVAQPITAIKGANVLLKLGDSVTTDHISPAGAIPDGPAEKYLLSLGVERNMFNSFGSRRGNDRVMTRGTFANIRIQNQIAPGTEGGFTTYLGPDATPTADYAELIYNSDVDPKKGEVCYVYDAAVKYQKHHVPLVVLAGKDYGMGSSRDWAAKGTFLLGVKAVIAESYERIHRSNLIGMGVLPLQFPEGKNAGAYGLTGHETFDVIVDDHLQPLQKVHVKATAPDGKVTEFDTTCRIDTPVEVDYYRNGGILHYVLRRMAAE